MSTQSREQSRTQKAAAIQAAQARRERNRKVAITAAIIVLVAAIVSGGYILTRPSSSTSPAATPANLKSTAGTSSLTIGNAADAPVKVVVYEDFLCPYCKQFESETRGFLRTDAAEGKVTVEYRPFHFLSDDYSTLAANAWSQVLEGGTPKQALAFHDALFDNQPYEQDANKPGVADLKKLAAKAGVSKAVQDTFGTENKAFFTAAQGAAQKAKINQTPSVFVNGKAFEADQSVDQLASDLEKLIAKG